MVSEAKKQRWLLQMNDPDHQREMVELLRDQRKNPYAHSQLVYWLSLDLWERSEGLQVLAGIEPGTIETAPFDREWIDGQPFAEHISFKMLDPIEACPREDYPGDDESYQSYLECAERKRSVLAGHQQIFDGLEHRLDRSLDGLGDATQFKYRPVQFLAWARSIGFTPPWFAWAKENGKLPREIEPMAAPFFDADADDYPELLHIAVSAWEHARTKTQGTPKQRVLGFLAERYGSLPQGSRDAIAQVVNWRRTGGRPTRRPKTGG